MGLAPHTPRRRSRGPAAPRRSGGARVARPRDTHVKNALVPEVPAAGKDHRHPMLVGGGNYLVIATGAARLHDGGRACLGDCVKAVSEWKERIRGGNGPAESSPGLEGGNVHGIHPTHLTRTNGRDPIGLREDDRVRLGVRTHAPREAE